MVKCSQLKICCKTQVLLKESETLLELRKTLINLSFNKNYSIFSSWCSDKVSVRGLNLLNLKFISVSYEQGLAVVSYF